MGKILKIILILSIAFVFSFCNSSEKHKPETKVLNVGVEWVSKTYDPHKSIGLPDVLWQNFVFEPLFKYDENLTPVPVLVEKITYNKKKKFIVIKLKKNRKFSNGEPVTSRDIIESFKRSLKLYPFSSYLMEIKGAAEFKTGKARDVKGLVATGKDSLKVYLKRTLPIPSHLFSTPDTSIVKVGCNGKCLYGTGPYRISSIRKSSRETTIELKPNPYFEPAPSITTVNFHLYHSRNAFFSQIGNCKLDIFVNYIPYKQEVPSCYTIIRSPLMGGLYMILNPWLPPTDKREIRYLLRYLSWKSKFAETIKYPLGIHPKLIVPYGLVYFSFLKTAGFQEVPPKDLNLTLFTMNLKEQTRMLFLEYLARKLSNYKITLKNLGWVRDWGEFTRRGDKKKVNFFLIYYVPSSPSSYYFFYSLFSPKGELNEYNYPYPEGLKLLEKYAETESGKERVKLLNEMEKIAEKENTSFPVMYTLFMVGKKKSFYGLKTNNLGFIFLRNLKKLK